MCRMKRWFLVLFSVVLLGQGLVPHSWAVSTSAKSAILMEAESGRVLYEQNIHQESLIASITKLMTALVALESGRPLKGVVPITSESVGVEGSSLYLKEEERITLEALLYGLLLHSGNDAATAIAIHCGGSVEEFVGMMNQKAQELGMEHSQFANPHGLDQEGHHSSAYDMALVGRACLENETLAKMVGTQSISLGGRSFTNKNKLLWYYEGCNGMKTGYTQAAGRTLVSSATRDGMTLICVTLNDPNDWVDHQLLYDYGFETYQMTQLSREKDTMIQLPLAGSLLPFAGVGLMESHRYPLKAGESVEFELVLQQTTVTAPLAVGDEVAGRGVWRLGEQEILAEPLVCLGDYPDVIHRKLDPWSNFLAFIGQ